MEVWEIYRGQTKRLDSVDYGEHVTEAEMAGKNKKKIIPQHTIGEGVEK